MPGKTSGCAPGSIPGRGASMRPQRNAGENPASPARTSRGTAGFNEAPAKCRGKPGTSKNQLSMTTASMRPQRNAGENAPDNSVQCKRRRASMRPQRNAGENSALLSTAGVRYPCFNEAPAKCRGKRLCTPSGGTGRSASFNEAPAKCRGKLAEAHGDHVQEQLLQ